MATLAKKATFSLHEDLLEDLDQAVSHGAAASKNAFVERALVRELREWRRQQRRARWQQAAKDPLFLKDIAETEAAFREADAETARRIG